MVSNKRAEKAIERFFQFLNINLPKETPKRYTKMILELTQYQNVSNLDIANEVNKTFPIDEKTESKNMVIVKNIETFSLCKHHIALMYDMKISVAYIPKEFVLGLSKIVRLSEMVCKRLQLQEKISDDILEIMKILTKSDDIAICIKAKHSCVTSRGIRNINSETITNKFSDCFLNNLELQKIFLDSLIV